MSAVGIEVKLPVIEPLLSFKWYLQNPVGTRGKLCMRFCKCLSSVAAFDFINEKSVFTKVCLWYNWQSFLTHKKEIEKWLTRLMLLLALVAVAARIPARRKLSLLATLIPSTPRSALTAALARPPARLAPSPRRDRFSHRESPASSLSLRHLSGA